LKYDANDLSRQSSALGLQTALRRRFILLDGCSRLLYLSLRSSPGFCNRCGSRLQRLLAARFLALEYRHARFPQTLLVIRGSRFGLGNIRSRFLDRPFGEASPLGQHLHQRLVYDRRINAIQQNNEYDGGYGPEQ
jgi:hypothetical protein